MNRKKDNLYLLFIISGIVIYLFAELMKFSGVYFFRTFFTPLAWTAYIIFADGINYRYRGRSLIIGNGGNFIWMSIISIGLWYVFEFYNLFLDNWHYINLPASKTVRYFGYFWSFATIWPGIFETYLLLTGIKLFDKARVRPRKMPIRWFWTAVITGAVFEILPFLFPGRYWAPAVWIGFILLLDPINCRLGRSSLTEQLGHGLISGFLRFGASGLICGFLWEFWNYWAGAKWVYTIPYWGNVKIFEMPVIGYLGFIPFGIEVFTMYIFAGWMVEKLLGIKGIGFQL